MDKVCMYLRKSRSDEELERQYGEGETLSRHRNMLLKFAKEKSLNIIKIYEEIVSGESLICRAAMLEMLKNIENNMFDAVLVMDIDRLGRGNMQEQGLILETFKSSHTKIITPRKTYDLNDDFDEEYSEFESFMSRKELKLINRRLQRGRIRSIEEGNYIGTYPPYGYLKKDGTLIPHPEQAQVVKIVFDWYVNKNYGCSKIAEEFDKMGIKPYLSPEWNRTSISTMIKNEVYIGKLAWKKHKTSKSAVTGIETTAAMPKEDWIVVKGRHVPLIDEDLFRRANEILSGKHHVPYQIVNGVKNPMAGLVFCKVCGNRMISRPYGDKAPHLICLKKCGNKSSRLDYVEKQILFSLQEWSLEYEMNLDKKEFKTKTNEDVYRQNIETLEKGIQDLHNQKLRLHDLLEQGVYNIETFLERSTHIGSRLEQLTENIKNLKYKMSEELKTTDEHKAINELKRILETYHTAPDAMTKNSLLRLILDRVVYFKDKSQKNDQFTIITFPKLPI